jgi:hypothetical protein
MLKQLIFAPCEKVILSTDNTASLISVAESIQVSVPADMPADALVPLQWTVLSLWYRQQTTDTPIEFEERVDVVRQDGSVATGATSKFTVSDAHLMYRTLASFAVFPIGQSGVVLVKNRIRQINPETEWIASSEYPVQVVHLTGPVPATPVSETQPAAGSELTSS